jgi:hypothetical protein
MSNDKMRIKSAKTGKEQNVSPETYKKLQAFSGIDSHEVISDNTTPPEARAARARTNGSAAPVTGTVDADKADTSTTVKP